MRKYLLIAALLPVFLLVSCSRETLGQESAGDDFTLTVAMPSSLTKTVLGIKAAGAYPVLWSVGDYITVNGVQSKPLTALEAGATTATFRFSQSIKTPYHVQYGTEVPSSQLYTEGNIRSFAAPMSAVSYGPSFTMEHTACILSIPLNGSVSVSGLSVSAPDGTPLSGSGGAVQLTMPSGGVSIASGKTFCVALKPAALSKGLCLDVYTTEGKRMNLFAFEGETLEAGKVYEFPSTAFKANAHSVIVINSYSELQAFATRVASGEKYLEARLGADISVDSSWETLDGFTGDFDGGGYTVSGLQKAFANELRGCIRNLTVEGNIAISSKDDIAGDENVYWTGILCNRMYTGARVSSCTVKGSISYSQWGKGLRVGSIVGYAVRGSIENCTSSAAVTVVGDGSVSVEAGGLVGRAYASSDEITVKSSSYNGTLSLSGTLKTPYVGGIAGLFDPSTTSTFSGNHFGGAILFSEGSVLSGDASVGGIAGAVKLAALDNCTMEGEILLRAASAGNVYAGGVLGRAQSYTGDNSIVLSGCAFKGNLTVDIATHSTLHANQLTGLYSTGVHEESGCETEGTVVIK